jgi:hypothetical protein
LIAREEYNKIVLDASQDPRDGYHLFLLAKEKEDGTLDIKHDIVIGGFDPPEEYELVGVVHPDGIVPAQIWVDQNEEEYIRLSKKKRTSKFIQ